ncbi:MAG: hypothetical protein ACOC10_10455 [Bacteroidota bacterium]
MTTPSPYFGHTIAIQLSYFDHINTAPSPYQHHTWAMVNSNEHGRGMVQVLPRTGKNSR